MSATAVSARPRLSVLALAQVSANLGFYLVLPFLAAYAAGPLGLAPWAVGLVLGVRTFTQQGLFLVGGLLSDRYGARRLVVVGCAVRVVGYVALGLADSLGWLLVGAALTGFGGALFSPSLDALAALGGSSANADPRHGRLSWFAILTVAAEVGAVTGPVVGALVIGRGFTVACLIGAVLFAVLGTVLAGTLPPRRPVETAQPGPARIGLRPVVHALADPEFRRCTIAYAVYLVCFNQLYLALPREIERVGGPESDIGVVFAVASVATIALQWPGVRLIRRWGVRSAARIGLVVIGAGFVAIAAQVPWPSLGGWGRLVPALSWVLLLVAGQALLLPSVKAAVAENVSAAELGVRYGALATTGGLAVLVTSVGFGAVLGWATTPSALAAVPWLLPAGLALVAALVLSLSPGEP